ncbi:MAG TPA: apolipoprotein N-acyltransferase, partial [Myxococcota bacterium]|nr:apolipoprotein N-acyltransferase [Myxococcota bacterium]
WRALETTRGAGAPFAAALGLAFGAVAYAGGFPWLWRIVDVFLAGNVALGALLWLAYGAWFAATFVVYALAFHFVRRRGWPLAVAALAPLVAVEGLLPQVFPVYAGAGLVAAPAWVQTADLGGPLLLTALLVVANLAAFASFAWLRGERPRPLGAWLALLLVAGAALGYGRLRADALAGAAAGAPGLRVGIVQANLGLLEKREQGIVTHRRHLEQTRELLAAGPLDLVVWPETALVRGLRRPLPVSGRPVRAELDVPLLFGGTSVWEEDGRRRKANSAFLVGADGWIRTAYDKNLLIPLAEVAPLGGVVPAVERWFPHVQEFRAARDTPPLELGRWRISTPICYEAIRPELVRRMVREGRPHLLVTIANDAWFGDSHAPWMHLALARLRAVEHRRWLVRATNSGISAVVDPTGRIVARTGLLTRESLRATVAPLDGETLYSRTGDWPGWLAAATSALALALPAPRRARRQAGPGRRPSAPG